MGLTVWDSLVRTNGRGVVIAHEISDDRLDAETDRQKTVLEPIIARQLQGWERSGLDFGCGYGRFTPMLANLIAGRAVGYDPSVEMIRAARGEVSVEYQTGEPDAFFHEMETMETKFDVVLAFGVLGAPGIDLPLTIAGLSDILVPNGLLVVVDHVVPTPDPGRWWRFRPPGFYEQMFEACGVPIWPVGKVMQLENEMTILSGRRLTTAG